MVSGRNTAAADVAPQLTNWSFHGLSMDDDNADTRYWQTHNREAFRPPPETAPPPQEESKPYKHKARSPPDPRPLPYASYRPALAAESLQLGAAVLSLPEGRRGHPAGGATRDGVRISVGRREFFWASSGFREQYIYHISGPPVSDCDEARLATRVGLLNRRGAYEV